MSTTLRTIILFILAAVSTVANYAGLSQTVPENSLWWLLFAAAIALAVGALIYAFWQAAFDIVSKPDQFRLRSFSWVATLAGAVIILGISSFWNVAAIGGKAAQTAALQGTVTRAETVLANAQRVYSSHRSHLPALQSLSLDIGNLKDCEGSVGCVTGTKGKKGVYQTLAQLQDKTDGLITAINEADAKLLARANSGKTCLVSLRSALAKDETAGISKSTDCVNGILGDIAGNGLSARIADSMDAFTAGIVMPVSITREHQMQAVANILNGLQERANAIGKSARASVVTDPPQPITVARMSTTKAVTVHYEAILPSWVTGIALDSFPLILLYFSAIRAASYREKPDAKWRDFTAEDLLSATKLLNHLKTQTEHTPPPDDNPPDNVEPRRSPNGIVYKTIDLDEPDYWLEDVELRDLRGEK